MNVTLGVPRINEIFNAAETIKTPIIEIELDDPENEIKSIFIKNQINAIYMEDVLVSVREIYEANQFMMELIFNMEEINKSFLGVM